MPSTQMVNITSLTVPWNASNGMHRLWRQIQDAANYATYVGHPINNKMLVDASQICIAKSQAYNQAYLYFCQLSMKPKFCHPVSIL